MISDVFLDHSTYADPPSRLVVIHCLTCFCMDEKNEEAPVLRLE